MNIQLEQIAHLAIYVALATMFWQVKSKYLKGLAVVLAFILFTMSPIRQTIEKSRAQAVTTFDIPEKVVVKEREFNTHKQLEAMQQENKERFNEITK